MRHAVAYPIGGAVLAMGAPLGAWRCIASSEPATSRPTPTLPCSTTAAFLVLRWHLGRSMDALAASALGDGLTGVGEPALLRRSAARGDRPTRPTDEASVNSNRRTISDDSASYTSLVGKFYLGVFKKL